jgi:hypothetical protein
MLSDLSLNLTDSETHLQQVAHLHNIFQNCKRKNGLPTADGRLNS